MENLNNIDEQQNTYDFSEFETIGNRVLVVSINKSFVLNTPLRKCFPGRKSELSNTPYINPIFLGHLGHCFTR